MAVSLHSYYRSIFFIIRAYHRIDPHLLIGDTAKNAQALMYYNFAAVSSPSQNYAPWTSIVGSYRPYFPILIASITYNELIFSNNKDLLQVKLKDLIFIYQFI